MCVLMCVYLAIRNQPNVTGFKGICLGCQVSTSVNVNRFGQCGGGIKIESNLLITCCDPDYRSMEILLINYFSFLAPTKGSGYLFVFNSCNRLANPMPAIGSMP